MSIIINDNYSIEESLDNKYNLEFNECVASIKIYCNDNQLPFLKNFNYNEFYSVIKKNINFSKIEIRNVDDEESTEDELSDNDF